MTTEFSGAKGGGGEFRQRPDTLRSNDVFEGVLGMAAGPMKGLVKGLKSQKLNGTAVEDASGVANFKNIMITVNNGDPALFPQPVITQLGSGGIPTSVGLTLTNTDVTGTVPGDWVVQTMSSINADFIDLRFIVQQLFYQDKSGIGEITANLEIQMKPTGLTTWINPNLNVPTTTSYDSATGGLLGIVSGVSTFLLRDRFDGAGAWNAETNNGYLNISGKTTSAYVKELRIRVPNTGAYAGVTWDVRVRLREPASIDADPNFTKRIISWETIAGGFTAPMGTTEGWRGLSVMQVYGKATDEFNGVPKLEGVWDTKIVSVPPIGVYNPETRQYTGTLWDGSFSKAYTNDPAWVINDALSDGLFGMSSLSPGSYLNKWDALEVSKWCSELVWDGDVGTQPRFSLNFRSQAPQKADEFIQYLAGAVGGFAWDNGNGEWRMKLDKPEAPSDIFTLENIESEFAYSHTDISTRFNQVTIAFLNEDLDYREDRVTVVDLDAITAYGLKPTTVIGIGCTNRQEAVRRAQLRLRASQNETRMVTFSTNRRGRLLTPFCTVLIADSDLGYQLPTGSTVSEDLDEFNNRTTGRVVGMNPARTEITLRDTVRLELGVTYTLHFSIPNPNYNPGATTEPADGTWDQPTLATTRTITNTSGQRGDVRTLYLGTALPAGTPDLLSVAIEAAGLPSIPVMYRVLGVNVDDQNPERHTISCIQVDTGKWASADAAVAGTVIYQAPSTVVPKPLAPSLGAILTIKRIPGAAADILNLVVNWQRPASYFLAGFRVQYRLNGGPLVVVADGLQDTSLELINPAEGFYAFEISSRDRRGNYSDPLMATLAVGTVVDGDFVSGSTVSQSMATDKTVAATYTGVVSSDDLAALVWAPVVTRGGTSIRIDDDTTYVISNTYGGTFAVDNTIASGTKGNITTSALTGNIAGGELVITVAGVAQPKLLFKVTKNLAAPPSGGGTAGAYPKLVTWGGGDFNSLNTASYTAIHTLKTVTLATGESLYGLAPLDINVSGTGGVIRTMSLKWQYSIAGAGSWSDFASPITSSTATSADWVNELDPSPGYVEVTQTKSGLSANDYDVRLVGICSATGRNVSPSGTASIEVKV